VQALSSFEYVSVLASIIIGFALSDILRSLQALLRLRGKVRWDWAAPLVALLVTLTIIQIWWTMYQPVARPISIGEFLPMLVELVLLSLLASAVFPDSVPETGLDLRLYYDEYGSFIWTLFTLALGWLMTVQSVGALQAGVPLKDILGSQLIEFGILSLMVSLIFVRKRWWHLIAFAILSTGPLGWLSRTLG
jgi:hypothetical protein